MAVTLASFFSGGIDPALSAIIADIPLFSVGLLSIGALTFLFFMRRADWLVLCLHTSVVIAFVASILDLAQVVTRGSRDTDLGRDLSAVSALITAREVGYSFSVGLRFFFYWGFVAEPPPGEGLAIGKRMHNGSWGRWGVLGMGLKWSTLVFTLTIPILQILFRNVNSLHKLGPVYEVESTIEIVLSAVFILKLLLNSWIEQLANPDAVPGKRVMYLYSPVIAALLLSVWISVGDILSFEFSETTLGRVLQAIELYIAILYTLVAAFYHLRAIDSPFTNAPLIGRYTPFQGLPQLRSLGPSFRIATPMISTPEFVSITGNIHGFAGSPQEDVKDNGFLRPSFRPSSRPSQSRRESTPSRITSWLNNARRLSNRPPLNAGLDGDDVRLWKQEDEERGESQSAVEREYEMEVPLETPRTYDEGIVVPAETVTWQNLMNSPVLPATGFTAEFPASTPRKVRSPSQGSDVPFPVGLGSRKSSFGTLPRLNIPRTPEPGYIESPPSAYATPKSAVTSLLRSAGGVARTPTLRRTTERSDQEESSRISELIRQQMELEQSIAALRLFSPDPALREADEGEGEGPRGSPGSAQDQSATQSEFSLSNFPEPPWGRASTASTVTIPALRVVEEEEQQGRGWEREQGWSPAPSILEPPLMPAAIDELMASSRVPSSYSDSNMTLLGSRTRTGSGGTQYEITSFIGKLTDHRPKTSISSSVALGHDDEWASQVPRPVFARPAAEPGSPGSSSRLAPHSPRRDTLPPSPLRSSVQSGHTKAAASVSSARPFAASSESRFARPVGLPPRPRLASKDTLSTVVER